MKPIKDDINRCVDDCIVALYNKAHALFIRKKIDLINGLRRSGKFGHFVGRGFVEAARQYFDKF